jgi:hypothetical protein
MINTLFLLINPHAYQLSCKLLNKIQCKHAFAQAIHVIHPLKMLGTTFIFNCQIEAHFDKDEWPQGWTPLVCLGCAEGRILELDLPHARMKFKPSTVVWIRGGILCHCILNFTGQRISLAYFLHKGVWEEFDMLLPEVLPYTPVDNVATLHLV